MRFFIMGGTGFIGGPLIRQIIRAGHEVTVLTRNAAPVNALPPQAIPVVANPLMPGKWQEIAGSADVIINLVGSSILTRWTKRSREKILESRILATRMAVEAIPASRAKQMTLINANAVGYYGDTGPVFITEESSPGKGFLAEVTQRWQQEAEVASERGARVIIPRFGAVLGRGGGALARMIPPFRLGIGGRLGNGRQWFSWIHMDDLVKALLFVAENDTVTGVVNMCSPEPVTNLELTRTLSKLLKRPAVLPVPGIVLKLVIGGASEIVLQGQRVFPEILKSAGFVFAFPTLETALKNLMGDAVSSLTQAPEQ